MRLRSREPRQNGRTVAILSSQPQASHPVGRARRAFRKWRRQRPFWAGVWAIVGGAVIAYVPGTAFKFSLVPGSLIWVGVLVGVLIIMFGLFLWLQPDLRYLLGTLIIVFSLGSFMSSDFGGLLLGMLLGLIGGAMAVAWAPLPSRPLSDEVASRAASDGAPTSVPTEALPGGVRRP